jgi:hypothetical protein
MGAVCTKQHTRNRPGTGLRNCGFQNKPLHYVNQPRPLVKTAAPACSRPRNLTGPTALSTGRATAAFQRRA